MIYFSTANKIPKLKITSGSNGRQSDEETPEKQFINRNK
jgi:hypothetical protein